MNDFSKTQRLALVSRHMRGNPESQAAQRLLALIDGERISSAPGIVELYHRDAAGVRADPHLNDAGKLDRTRALASSRLGGIATVAREVASLEREHKAKQAQILERAAPQAADAAQAVIDVELVKTIDKARPFSLVLETASPRMREALARLPLELTNLNAEQHARVIGSFVSAEDGIELQETAAALELARQVTQTAIDELQATAKLEPPELVRMFSNDWKLPGVIPSLVNRLHAQQAAESGAGALETD